MDLLLWITIGFIIIGFVVLTSMKKGMESKVAFIKANMEEEENSSKAKSVIWWIWSTTAWGIVSIFLVVWCFHNHFG
ncbi:Na+/proline symporter [Lysinibacillus parviboronicapiens]|uniref:Na+/proline symporter n=1 Tax=Lysinibacillus parviboronicapiens TaxID=436516 RepID=A0ABV2PRI7_9BACI